MKVVVFGANGKVGSLVTEILLENNHKVTAFIRGEHHFLDHQRLTIMKGDVYNNEVVYQAIVGANAVISCLGSWGTKNKDILTAGMKNIIPAMHQNNIKRIITLTGSDALLPNQELTFTQRLTRPLLNLTASKILKDGEDHLKLLQDSDLNWTTIRSPIMNEAGNPKSYHLKEQPLSPFQTIHRQSVALSMVNQLTDKTFFKEAPFIYRTKENLIS